MGVLRNPKHERFAQALAKGETADAAYQIAGYKPNRHNASRLKTKETIATRVAELQDRAAIKVEITVADIARQLDEDRRLAHQLGQPGAAVSASMGKAKVFGLLLEKVELTGKDGGPVQYQDAAEAEIAEIFGSNPQPGDIIVEER